MNINGTRATVWPQSAGSDNLLNWNPNANNQVRDLMFDSSGTRLFAGDPFTNIGTSTRNRIVALKASSSTPLPFSGTRPTMTIIKVTAEQRARPDLRRDQKTVAVDHPDVIDQRPADSVRHR